MQQLLQKAILFVNLLKKNAESSAAEIRRELESRGTAVTVLAFEGHPGFMPEGPWDIAFSLGGDGTVLYAARSLVPFDTPILPLHLGTLGFLTVVECHQWLSVYEQWLNRETPQETEALLSSRCMLELSVVRKGLAIYGNTCLNDIVIAALGIAKLIRLQVKTEFAPGKFADLGCYRSDGLIISTPTGSTAYSMAAGGPILDPEMEAQIITPICPFTLSNRPLVLPSRQTLMVTVDGEQRSGVLLTVDGQDTLELEPNDTVTIRNSPHYARFITGGRSSYYQALKEKLAWSVGEDSIASAGGSASRGGGHA